MSENVNDLLSLKDKVAVITGGAGWLGSAMTEALAEAGARTVVVDCNAEAVKQVCERLAKKELSVTGVTADVMQEDSIRESIDHIAEECGRIDVLVNGVVVPAAADLEHVTMENFEKGYRNSAAYAIACQQCVKHMRKVGGGSIINIASMYGMVTSYPEVYEGVSDPCPVTYCADKAGVIHMTRFMAVYWAKDKIRVNSISPGAFPNREKMEYTNNPKMDLFLERLAEKSPLGRVGQPWELKGAVVFLASRAASFLTGQNIVIDGGWTIW